MNGQGAGCGCLVLIIVLGIFKSAGISWLTHGKYGWTLGKSILIFLGITAGIILLAAIGIGIAGVIDWLNMKRAKQRDIHAKPNADVVDEVQNRVDKKEGDR